jgi:hypothetical protein
MDKESNGGMVILPVITSSSTMNPQVLLPGIASPGTRNPSKEENSVGNCKLMEADSNRQDQNARKILQTVTISGSSIPNHTLQKSTFFRICILKRY